jgi:hypothetical protein
LLTEWVFEPCSNHYHFGQPEFFSQGWLPSPKDPTLKVPYTCSSPLSQVFKAVLHPVTKLLWEIGICLHSTLNLMSHVYKWSLSRRTSVREDCLMTKTLFIPVLLSVLCLYLLPLPMLCFVYFPIFDLPHPPLIGHLITFMLS